MSKCLKTSDSTIGLCDEIWRFLKMILFGVCDFTLSYFQNKWTDSDTFCIILMRNQCMYYENKSQNRRKHLCGGEKRKTDKRKSNSTVEQRVFSHLISTLIKSAYSQSK